MDFEIGHLDMINTDHRNDHKSGLVSINQNQPQSLILNELHKETEELQNKLKLNHRRLLLFETENNKLIEEKNRLFFEAQNAVEKYSLINEKILALENETESLRAENDLLHEKNNSFLQINHTQLVELKRFTKFHLKIQNVIKPYIEQLKKSVADQKGELQQAHNLNQDLSRQNSELAAELKSESESLKAKIFSMERDKAATISSYEEQIHSFSKEIIRLEQRNDDFTKEIGRLKKAVEFKNYFENELIKFKRVHEDDQREIFKLNDKLNVTCVKLSDQEQIACMNQEKLKSTESHAQNIEQVLESTRMQLTKQIDHSNTLSERLSRLENLNLNLSQQMQAKN